MEARTWRELLGWGRGARSLEQARLFLAATVSMGGRLSGELVGLGWASRGQRSGTGATVHSAQAFMQMQCPAPPCQLSLQGLDLLPKGVVVFLQGLVLLREKQVAGRDVRTGTLSWGLALCPLRVL